MTMRSASDQQFIAARQQRKRIGLLMLPSALALVVIVWGLFFVALPGSVNPWTVLGRIEQRLLEPGTLTMYAVSATILMNVVFGLLCACLVMGIAWARHERRYLKLLSDEDEKSAPPSAAENTPTLPK